MTEEELRALAFRFLDTHPLTYRDGETLQWSGGMWDAQQMELDFLDLTIGQYRLEIDGGWCLGKYHRAQTCVCSNGEVATFVPGLLCSAHKISPCNVPHET